MKVLHLCSEMGWRGGEQQVVYLTEELISRNVDVVLAVRKGSVLEQYCRDTKKSFFSLSFANSVDLLSAYKIDRICKAEKIDIIHMHTSKAHGSGVLSTFFGNKVPMVLSRRVDFVPNSNRMTKWKYNHPQIKRIIGVSNKITHIMQAYVEQPQKCITVYSGIDLNKFSHIDTPGGSIRDRHKINPDCFLIGNTAALADHKDYFTFIDTIQILHQDGLPVHAFIIGDGPLRTVLEKYVSDKDLNQIITFTGFQKQVGEYLLSLDLFLMTSKEEGLGTSLLDAFLARVPVVATAAGGIPEIVINNKTGLVSSIGDAKSLANNVSAFMNDNVLSAKIVDEAYHFVLNFSKQKMAEQTLSVYKNIIEAK
jgi:glycosyltransferase involved in cell wall biosynthesis